MSALVCASIVMFLLGWTLGRMAEARRNARPPR